MRKNASNLITLALLLPVAFLAVPIAAQQAKQVNGYEIHYNTLNTSQLSPEIASVYGIQRAQTRAMLTITVLDSQEREPQEAEITARATNLTGQERDIGLRQIDDQGAVYYIGQFRVHHEEILNFDVQVQPAGHQGQPFELSFRQQFFTD